MNVTARNRLRELRNARGYSQEQLEEMTGIERSKISRIETGTRRISGSEAIYLAEALGATPEELFTAQPSGIARFRGGSAKMPADARATVEWFRHFVDDMLFVDRTAERYGVE